jgi:subtilisin-like proprotein convertase family protein
MKINMLSRLLLIATCACSLPLQAGIIYSSTSGSIPDGSTLGWSATATASGYAASVSDIRVNLDISGGYNGDLYAYLSYGGVLVPLLNRVGVTTGNSFGYADTGFNVTLSGAGSFDVHSYNSHSPTINGNGQLTGTWQPDGRAIDPVIGSGHSAPGDFAANGTMNFGSYSGMDPNGTWTLFFADVSRGGGTSTLNGWSLDITAVPEPVNVALGVFAALACGIKLLAWRRQRA